jgi:hypothetical protein
VQAGAEDGAEDSESDLTPLSEEESVKKAPRKRKVRVDVELPRRPH